MRLDFFEGIVAVLPILLFALVSIFLRTRSSARLRRLERESGEGKSPTAPGEPPVPAQPQRLAPSHEYPRPFRAERLRGVIEPAAAAAGETLPRQALADSEIYPLSASGGDVFRPPEPSARKADGLGRAEQRFPPVQEASRGLLSSVDRSSPPGPDSSSRARSASIAARLNKLPPLQRAVVWAEILGPPGAGPERRA